MFTLDPRLAADTHELERRPLCLVLLMNDSQYPWLILVPQRSGARDLIDLDEGDRAQLMVEIADASQALRVMTRPHKLNVAALGNAVPQLHVHVIARFTTDPAWPRPVWGVRPGVPYATEALAAFRAGYEAARSAARASR
jgi:diadenosine tetraphosphate (Ap4A) HIT family hydrolase